MDHLSINWLDMNLKWTFSSDGIAVDFGSLSEAEIRALSVKRITNPVTFDSLLHPTPGGLYDAALGAFLDNRCATCHLNSFTGCPGHCGHVELPIRVYHPIFMDQCLRLLRAKCVFCHHLRMSRTKINQFSCKLQLIHHGLIQEAKQMESVVEGILDRSRGSPVDSSDDDANADDSGKIRAQRIYTERAIRQSLRDNGSAITITEVVVDARRRVVRDFMSEITNANKCSNCGGHSPGFRKDGFTKIFRKSLPAKKQNENSQKDLNMRNPLVIVINREKKAKSVNVEKKPNGIVVDEGVADMDISAEEMESEEGEPVDIEVDSSDELVEEDAVMTEEARATPFAAKTKSNAVPSKSFFMTSEEVHAALVLLFERETAIMRLIYSPQSKGEDLGQLTADMFFIKTLLIPPSRYRPEGNTSDSAISEAARNSLYKSILTVCENIGQISQEIKGQAPTNGTRIRTIDDLKASHIDLQNAVNTLIDIERRPTRFGGQSLDKGIKQILEKKEGLFRQNMMGKRVNFAARSVISPDPNIETNEIGVPPVFATKLTYPEPVTSHNFYELKEAIINGPFKWPGAVAVEDETGQVMALKTKNADDRLAIANQLLAPSSTTLNGRCGKKVHRHLNNGDILIMNRQPTLHKPSMMCHRARVLPREKTIRMHYANCNTYNADFDGDEMNMHFPQNEVARSEALMIADTDHQYLSGTAGKPLRGLIQDHISISVHLTNKDLFFDREEYQQLLYSAIRPESGHTSNGTILTVPPTIMKPKPLWTGKQVITTVLKNITPRSHAGLCLDSKSQTAGDQWGSCKEEEQVIFRDGELLCGIIDKKQIGPAAGGLVHSVYECYGHVIAGRLLSILGRLLTKLLHMRAFSCGVQDIVLTPEGEKIRKEKLERVDTLGLEVAMKYVTLESRNPTADDPELRRRLETVLRDAKQHKGLDEVTKGHNNLLSSEITKACLPTGLVKPFPKNQMQTMTQSGAKGSSVNANLISCNLGQQVLEGRRVPTMVSGKTLPCFKPFESSIRAGGYIADRFLTGVKPQEYYFHAMAGREGLIDTAVKTARSGYLQRCLIKGMEGLKVEYDTSVRDADGTIVQFLYGEDGLDIGKQKYLHEFKFLAQNFLSIYQSMGLRDEYAKIRCEEASSYNKKTAKAFEKRGFHEGRDPALSIYNPMRFAGSTSEKFYLAMKKYIDENPDKIIADRKKKIQGNTKRKHFEALLEVKYMKSVVEPGEAVGVIAGQSIGEPSTQMTLNTFHLAGHASKNVTLGIPRLREVVMTASSKIATPMMTVHLNPEVGVEEGEKFAKSISRLSLSEVVEKVSITENIGRGGSYSRSKSYAIRFEFFPAPEYCEEYNIEVNDVLTAIAKKFLPALHKVIQKEFRKKGTTKSMKNVSEEMPDIGVSVGRAEQSSAAARRQSKDDDDDDDDDADDADDGGDGDATSAKQRLNREEIGDYDDPDEDEVASQASHESNADGDIDEDDAALLVQENDDDNETDAGDDTDEADDENGRKKSRPKKSIYIHRSAAELDSWAKETEGNKNLSSFRFDPSGEWCEATLDFDVSKPKLLMLQLVEQATRAAVIQAIPGLKSCILDKEYEYIDPVSGKKMTEPTIITEGTNLLAMRESNCQEYINPHKVFTNDIAAMLYLYGVEACRSSIIREIANVFESHAIDVDNRHLNLIADVMTRNGQYQAFNRMHMSSASSPFMKMSFETTVGFLKEAVLAQDTDRLQNPSARIVVGRLSGMGTGSFDVLMPTIET